MTNNICNILLSHLNKPNNVYILMQLYYFSKIQTNVRANLNYGMYFVCVQLKNNYTFNVLSISLLKSDKTFTEL